MKQLKQLLALLLCLALVLSLLPAALAAQPIAPAGAAIGRLQDDSTVVSPAEPASVIASGSCGDNLTWTLTDDGVLSITGTGAMNNYGTGADARPPWYENRDAITSVAIGDGVTSIGTYAFNDCAAVTDFSVAGDNPWFRSVDGVLYDHACTVLYVYPGGREANFFTAPVSVRVVEVNAFSTAVNLLSVTLPAVTELRENAFHNSGVRKVYCPKLQTIGAGAFSSCHDLLEFTFGPQVESIEMAAFLGCTGVEKLTFMGSAPTVGTRAFPTTLSADAYYPADDDTWTAEFRQSCGGNLNWIEYDSLPDGYYLIGPDGWTLDAVDPNDLLVLNSAQGNNDSSVDEYMLTATLTAGDPIKVVKVFSGAITDWYPSGTGNEYTVDSDHSGNVTIYFRARYNSAWSAFGGYIWIEAAPETKYGLRVNGDEVRSDHLSDSENDPPCWTFDGDHTLSILGDLSGNYDYLENVGLFGPDVIDNYGLEGLVIEFVNHAKLEPSDKANSTMPSAIYAGKDTVITGPGGGVCVSPWDAALLVNPGVTLTIRDTELQVTSHGGNAILGTNLGAAKAKLVVDHAGLDVTADTDDSAISGFRDGIELMGCEIVYPEGGRVSDDGASIVNADGSAASSVKIRPLPSVSYDLYINDVRVTDVNKDDVLYNGVFAFDPDTNVLTLHGDYACTIRNMGLIDSRIDGLTIRVAEDTILSFDNSDDDGYTFIISEGDLTVTGPGLLVMNGPGYDWLGAGVYIYRGDLTFDHARFVCTGMSRGIQGNGTNTLSVDTSSVYCRTVSGGTAIGGFSSGGITLTNSRYLRPSDADGSTGTVCQNGTALEEVKIRGISEYNLYIADVPVNADNKADVLGDGVFVYDSDDKTLTLNGSCWNQDESVANLVENAAYQPLTIVNASRNFLASEVPSNISATNIISSLGDLTIQNSGVLILRCRPHIDGQYTAAIMLRGSYGADPNTLRIVGGTLTLGSGFYEGFEGRGLGYSALEIDHADVYIPETVNAAVYLFRNGMTLTGVEIVEPEGGYFDDSAIRNPDGSMAKAVTIEVPTVYYGYRINGDEQSSAISYLNYPFDGEHTVSILDDLEGWREYDEFSNLTSAYDVIDNFGHEGLIINIVNSSRIITYDAMIPAHAIKAQKDTVITGTNGGCETYGEYSIGVYDGATLTIRDMSLTADGLKGYGTDAKLVVDHASLDVALDGITGYNAVTGFTGGIELIGCEIVEPAGGRISDDGSSIVNADGSKAAHVVIEPDHEHSPGEPVQENLEEPDCTTGGGYDTVVRCSVCGAELSREHVDLPELGHLLGEPVQENYVRPTEFTEGGYDTVTYCARCGIELDREHTVLPATADGFYLFKSDQPIDSNVLGVGSQEQFTPNPNNENEYILNTTLTMRDYVKVFSLVSGRVVRWYPESDYGYRVDAAHAGNVTIHFKPTYDPDWAEFGGHIWIEPLANPFVDVQEGKYYYDAVLWAFYHDPQVTNGTDDTHFSPNKTCTRAQVVTFLWRAVGCPEPTVTTHSFTDVKSTAYYYTAMLWAVENNITTGTSATTFGPNKEATRAQVVTFIWRTLGSPEPESTDCPFTDLKPTASYYKAVLWAVENGVTNGTSATTFSPSRTCTRGQVVTFLYNAFAE